MYIDIDGQKTNRAGFTLLILGLFGTQVQAKYGNRWKVEYGCKGKVAQDTSCAIS